MKAVELTVVFEDDDGKVHVRLMKGFEADVVSRALRGIDSILREHFPGGGIPEGEFRGPMLRKVTEVTGHVQVEEYDHTATPYISGFGNAWLVDLIPDECRKDCADYHFRFVCEAVRVEEPEKKETP